MKRDGIRVGLHVLGVGNASRSEVVAAVAQQVDELGFATLWCGEHVVMVDERPAILPDLAAAGVTELVVVAEPPERGDAAANWASSGPCG
jgi:alkanesulfonate monooxygenase SsuD/methylene tetrahydromethanopterin reductase-like flavin-dependent oxidoreductase (luciferase family)